MYLKLRYIYFHPMGMLYCCHVTGKLTPKPVLLQSNGAMWICGFVDLWIRGQSVHRSHVDLWICGFGAKSRSTFKTWWNWGQRSNGATWKSWFLTFPDPLPTLYDFVNIHDLKLHKNLSWMTLFPAKTEKVDFWPFLTFTDLGWLCMLVNHICLKTTWKIELNDTLHSSIW